MPIGHMMGALGRLVRSTGVGSSVTTFLESWDGVSGESVGDGTARERTDRAFPTREERITQIVEQNGGRIEQAEIVATLDSSAATVSRTLCGMEDRGAVVRYKVGRKKIVCLPGQSDLHKPAVSNEDPPAEEQLHS